MGSQTITLDDPIKSAAFSPDDARIAALTDKGLTFFDADTGARLTHQGAALTKAGKLETLLWIRPDLLVAFRFDAIHLVKLAGKTIEVVPIPCARVHALVASPAGDALLVIDGDRTEARLVSLATLESRALRKLDALPAAAWAAEGIALWSSVDGKPGKAELLTPEGEVLVKLATPKWEQALAVGVLDGALAAVIANRELHRLRAGEKKPTITRLKCDVDPVVLRADVGLAVFCDDVYTLPEGKKLGSLPEGFMTTVLSRDGKRAVLSDPDRAEMMLVEVPQPKASGKTKAAAPKPKEEAPRPGLDGDAWALVMHGVAVEGVEAPRVAEVYDAVAAIGEGATAVIDGVTDDGLFERLFAGVVVASTRKAPSQRATAEAVEIDEAACKAAEKRFAALRKKIVAALAKHDLEVEGEPGLWLIQAGPSASATLAAKKGGALREIEDEDEDEGTKPKAKKKLEVSYDATLSTRVAIEGGATLIVKYL